TISSARAVLNATIRQSGGPYWAKLAMRCAIRANFLASAPPPLPAVTRYRQLLIRSRRRPHRYTVYSTSVVVGRTNITQVSRASKYWLQLAGSLATCCDANTNV